MSDKEKAPVGRGGAAKTEAQQGNAFPIVGIGSSAGGLEASTALLKALDANLGMAYIFIPHLDPSRNSAFPEILARSTSMRVQEAQDGMQIKPNCVYVIPRNCDMSVVDRTIPCLSGSNSAR